MRICELSVKFFAATWDPSLRQSCPRRVVAVFSMGHSSDPGLTPCWGHYYIYLKENLPSTHAGEKAMKPKKKNPVVFVTYINWAVVKEGTIYCPVHGHLQVNDRRTTQTRIGQVIANRQTFENKSALKAMGWLRYQSYWLVRGLLEQNRRVDFVLDGQGIVFRFLSWQEMCLYCKSSIPAGVYPSSYSVFTGDPSGVKAAGVWRLTLNIPSLARQRCLPSWSPGRTPWFFCNFSTVWCGRLLKLCYLGFWNYTSVIQALLASHTCILCLFISTEVTGGTELLHTHSSSIWPMSSSEHCRRAIFQIYNVQNLKITRITTFRICNVVYQAGSRWDPKCVFNFLRFFWKNTL